MLELDTPAGREALKRLAANADVVVSAFAPGAADRCGADYETLRRANERLVYCSVTGWGPRGPYAGYPADEALVAAKAGRMQALEHVDRREGPTYEAVQVGTHAAAQSAVAGILAAIAVRERSGIGSYEDASDQRRQTRRPKKSGRPGH